MMRPRFFYAVFASIAVIAIGGLYQHFVLDHPAASPAAAVAAAPSDGATDHAALQH